MKNLRLYSLLSLAIFACQKPEPPHHLYLRYEKPAEKWTEALPIGNGFLGAMIYGQPAREQIQFNHETLWTGEPRSYAHDSAFYYLEDLRRLLYEGKQAEAHDLAMAHFMGEPLRQKAYQPFGDIFIEFPGHDRYTVYQRNLNLRKALSEVTYQIGDTTFHREYFASHPDRVIAGKFSANKKAALTFRLNMDSPHENHSLTTTDDGMILTVKVADGVLSGAACLALRITGGTVRSDEGGWTISGADEAVVLLSAATSYVRYDDVTGDPVAQSEETIATVRGKKYAALLSAHITDYQQRFNRFDISFGENERVSLPTDERISQFWQKPEDPQLIALYVQYARYLMIASSRSGTQPANLQGIWNDQIKPPWDGKWTTNINAEMNFWPAEITNLADCHESLFSLIEECAETGKVVAQKHYQARGWVLHHNTDIWRGTAPINHANHGIWVTGGAWLCQHLWEHYAFGQDKDFLRKAYPLMKGAAAFFVDYLTEDPETGFLVSGPSNSPENGGLVMGPTMDHQIIRSLFRNCAETAGILGEDAAFADTLRMMIGKIAPNQIGQHGQLQEWMEDKDDPENHHRHVSHLWGVYPGSEINWRDSPKLFDAARQSLIFRGDEGTGWSLAWKINFWARFLDGEHAYRMITMLLGPADNEIRYTRGGSYPNLFDAHPPFQIDGNFGAAAGITEMILQSHLGELHLLPALPQALNSGSVSGLRARGGYTLDMTWQNGEITALTLHANTDNTCVIRYQNKLTQLPVKAGKTYVLGKDFSI
ncbi:MAG: glycoside hydrolase family 95 protein [Bacteroidia bacterium]